MVCDLLADRLVVPARWVVTLCPARERVPILNVFLSIQPPCPKKKDRGNSAVFLPDFSVPAS